MRDQLPAWIDVQRLAPGFELDGSTQLSGDDDWPADKASVALRLRVAQASSGRLRLDGEIEGDTELLCQRCLQPMPVAWSSAFRLELVGSEEQAERVDSAVDIYIAHNGRIQLKQLVRDESVLALPMMPRHPDGACEPPGHTSTE